MEQELMYLYYIALRATCVGNSPLGRCSGALKFCLSYQKIIHHFRRELFRLHVLKNFDIQDCQYTSIQISAIPNRYQPLDFSVIT